jgi:hypothetical protein
MRGAGVLSCVVVLTAVSAAPALAAETMTLTTQPTVREGDVVRAEVSGNTDAPRASFKAYVTPGPCDPDVDAQGAKPGEIEQNTRTVNGGSRQGAFEFPALFRTDADGTQLTGTVNICSYLYRDDFMGTRTTVATDVDAVTIEPGDPDSPPFSLDARERQRMKRGRIRVLATCPAGCGVELEYQGLNGGQREASRSLPVRDRRVRIPLKLDRRTRRAVRRVRRGQRDEPVEVAVNGVATAPNGEKATVGRTVTVR